MAAHDGAQMMIKSPLASTLRATAAIFRPPFDGLWLVALLYIVFCYVAYPHSAVLRGDLPDTDDYMYLNQVIDWMKGQGWYDNIQHRLDPPVGVPIHFSRLAQLPMAALLGLFELCGLGPRGAGTVMATIYPVILLGCFFATLRWVAESFVPKEWAGASAFVALFSGGALFMFRPGHIDHHGLIVILVALAMGCVLRMMERPDQRRWAVYAGLIMAAGQTIALEILPWLLLLSGWVGLWAVVKGKAAAWQSLLYSLVFCVISFVCLALTRPPSDLMTIDVLTYSIVYVILAAGIAVTFAGIALVANASAFLRWIIGGGLAVGIGFLFLRHFPELVVGPYGGIDPALAQIILDEIEEALPFKTARNSWFDISRIAVPTWIAMIVLIRILCDRTRRPDERWRWGLQFLMLAAAFALSMFYQRRFVAMMGMLTIIPLTALLQTGWVAIGERWRGRARTYAEIGLVLLVGPLPAILYPAILDGRSFNTGILMFGAGTSASTDKCEMYELENALRDKAAYGDRPRLIMNTISSGPEILFRTDHSVLSAPFHMDVAGNVDATRFFSTPYPEEAEAIARRRHIDLVVACRAFPEVYVRVSPSKELRQGDAIDDFAPHFIQRLMLNKVPSWLKEAQIPGLVNYAVYEVHLSP